MISEEEKEAIESFKWWVDTNTEKGVSHIPDYICNNVLKYTDKLQKVINLMAEDRAELAEDSVIPTCKEAIIDFYFKQVEDKNETD